MPSIDDLEAAGRRAAERPVPAPPDVTSLQRGAGRHRSRRRAAFASFAAVAALGAGIPIGLSLRDDAPLEVVAAGTDSEADAAAPLTSQSDDPAPTTDDVAASADDTENGAAEIELRYGDEFAFKIEVLHGEEAAAAARAAEAAADETRDIEGTTVWIDRDGDTTRVSALVDPDHFIEVTGPTDQLDRLLEIMSSGGLELPAFPAFPEGDIEKFFEEFQEQFGEGFPFGEAPFVFGDGEDFGFLFDFENGELPPELKELLEQFEGFEGFDGELPDLQELFPEGELPKLDELFEQFGGELPDLEQFFEEGTLPDFEQFFEDGGFPEGFGDFGAEFDGCIAIDIQQSGEDGFQFEFPEGCSTAG